MMEYQIIKSRRKTLSLEITSECRVVVRAPQQMSNKKIEEFVNSHEQWANEKLQKMRIINRNRKTYSEADIIAMRSKAKKVIPQRVEFYSDIMGLYPTSVKITSAKKRFGSCSGKNSLCFSLYLSDYPQEAIDYVVVHELAHIKHHNHKKQFWSLVEKYLPDYKERQNMLKTI